MDISNIAEAIPEVGRILAAYLATGQRPPEPKKRAIRAVWSAVDNTRMYIRLIESGTADSAAPNPALVDLWSTAALEMMELDPDLAARLRDKADYWSDPVRWSDEMIAGAHIRIDAIASDARALLQLAVPHPHSSPASAGDVSDIFVSHASEDKDRVVRPLVAALKVRGLSVWYDEAELTLGDRLTSKIDAGLARCRFGVVVLSRHFVAKRWTNMELEGLLALEDSDGRKRVLPIRHGLSQAEVVAFSPLLGGRISMSTGSGVDAVSDAILAATRLPLP